MTDTTRRGFLYGLVAYGWWGLVPLYFRWLKEDVTAPGMLAHRVAWSVVFLAAVLTVAGRWAAVGRCFRTGRRLLPLTASAVLVGANWLVYIYSVHAEKIQQASLGYYITPLVSVLLGLFVFREHLRRLQWLALTLAFLGVGLLTWNAGEVPWIALVLAGSFSLYGLIRKQVPVDGLVGLSVESIILLPLALAYLTVVDNTGLEGDELTGRLLLSGIVTAIPLLCFGQAARLLPLSSLGFLQYVSPTIQLLVAVFLFGEPLRPGSLPGFVVVWVALAVFSVDSVLWYRRLGREVDEEPAPAEEEAPAEAWAKGDT